MTTLPRKYPGRLVRETVNSRPIKKPLARVTFDITPHNGVVTLATSSGTYSWNDVAPTMYWHQIGVVLTFTASLHSDTALGFVIDEWYWDFGDGTNATGQTVTHTYSVLNPNTIVHLRATDSEGRLSLASMNPMLH